MRFGRTVRYDPDDLRAFMQTERQGVRIFAFAPSADASWGTLRDVGFKEADTATRLLVDQKLQQRMQGRLIWIDEAGLIGSNALAEVFTLAGKLNARVLLSGDRFQHSSVEHGAALRLLETEAGLLPASIKEIQRQKGAYKTAIRALSEHDVEDRFERLDKLGINW